MHDADLPQLNALFLRTKGPADGARLIQAGPAACLPAPPATAADRDGGGYELRALVPPPALCELAGAGARFHLSRPGSLRVWLDGKIHAAATAADCLLDDGRRLAAEEVEYLNAYLISLGRSWNDVDQPRHANDPA